MPRLVGEKKGARNLRRVTSMGEEIECPFT
jgi:hypothetical protein